MSISIKDMLNQKNCSNFRLVSGGGGLDNRVETVGILDHEILDGSFHSFTHGDFVLSNFTAARGDISLFESSMLKLINQNVSGIAIKDIYFKTLPKEVIRASIENGIPIFFFSQEIYFEEIISEIMTSVRELDYQQLIQSKVHAIVNGNFSKETLKELALDLNSQFKETIQSCYCILKQPHKYSLTQNILKNNHPDYSSVINYRDGLLIISTADTESKLKSRITSLLSKNKISSDEFSIGFSSIYYGLQFISESIKESLTALKAAKIMGVSKIDYSHIGLYKILIPISKEPYSSKFSSGIMDPIRNYDKKYGTHLLETAEVFVSCTGNYSLASEQLFQHQNTIRFRVKKIKELLNITSSDSEFFSILSVAIKLDNLKNY